MVRTAVVAFHPCATARNLAEAVYVCALKRVCSARQSVTVAHRVTTQSDRLDLSHFVYREAVRKDYCLQHIAPYTLI